MGILEGDTRQLNALQIITVDNERVTDMVGYMHVEYWYRQVL